MTAIESKELSKRYGPVKALQNVTFSVQPGEIIGLLGPNGAGKTTLMKILSGYLQPDAGDASVSGIDVLQDRISLQRKIGYLPENAPLYGDMIVQDYLMTMATLRRVPAENLLDCLSEAVYATGLEQYLTRPIATLSKGYRQRVGIAQAILHKPEVLILDEPTTGLDPTQIADIRKLIQRLAEHSTVLLSTHILPEVEMTCERVLIIMQGRLRADATLEELRSDSSTVVTIESKAQGVDKALRAIKGAATAERIGGTNDFVTWRVASASGNAPDLTRSVFQVVRKNNWEIVELRSEQRSLEAVFRELAEKHAYTEPLAAGSDAASPQVEAVQ